MTEVHVSEIVGINVRNSGEIEYVLKIFRGNIYIYNSV